MAQPEARRAVPSRCLPGRLTSFSGLRTMPEASRSPSGLASLGSACRHDAPFSNGLLAPVRLHRHTGRRSLFQKQP